MVASSFVHGSHFQCLCIKNETDNEMKVCSIDDSACISGKHVVH
jgi:hypothetical protein